MTTFDDREKGEEARYKHDQEFQFKVMARRNKLLGMWAAEKMGMATSEAEAYAKEVVISDFDEPGDDDVLRKVLGDLTKNGVTCDEHSLRHEMDRLLGVASEQVKAE